MNDAAAILNHYFAALAKQSGMRWTAANAADIQRAAELLGTAALDEIPPFSAASTAARDTAGSTPGSETVSFERPAPSRDKFRQAREVAEAESTRRILQRETRP